MKRKLLKQTVTEWRSNLWIALELLIISVVTWFIVDALATIITIGNQPMGYDIENTYRVKLRDIPADSPFYSEDDSTDIFTQYEALINRLSENPDVEAVACTTTRPYNFNFWGETPSMAEPRADSTATLNGRTNHIEAMPEIARVWRFHGINGETPEQIENILKEGKIVVTQNLAEGSLRPADLINMRIFLSPDSAEVYTIGAVIPPLKRGEFEPADHASIILPSRNINDVVIRTKDGTSKDIASTLMELSKKTINYGNVYVAEVKSIDDIRLNFHRDDYAQERNAAICMSFLLLTVFLGILGTFWFRTQQRAHELAIRLTVGATRGQIFMRLIGEGLLICTLITPLALGLDCLLVHYDFCPSFAYFPKEQAWTRAIVEWLAVYASLMVMIVLGILFPAMRATKIQPAETLGAE